MKMAQSLENSDPRNDSTRGSHSWGICPELEKLILTPSTLPTYYDICDKKKEDGYVICYLRKGECLYKGMEKYCTEQDETKYFSGLWGNKKPHYFGNHLVSYEFRKHVGGGLHAYRTARDLKLFLYTDADNIERLAEHMTTAGYEVAAEELLLKTGVNRTIEQQKKRKQRDKVYYDGDVWTIEDPQFKPGNYAITRTTPGMNPFELSSLDRNVSRALSDVLLSMGLDGGTLNKDGVVGEEIILFDSQHALIRDASSPWDWQSYLKDNPLPCLFALNKAQASKNTGRNQVVDFYIENYLNFRKFTSKLKHDAVSSVPCSSEEICACTLNCHGFCSINSVDQSIDNIVDLCQLLRFHCVELLCLQEYKSLSRHAPTHDLLCRNTSLTYFHVWPKNRKFGDFAVFSCYPIQDVFTQNSIPRFRIEHPDHTWRTVVFENIHLEVGKGLYDGRGKRMDDYEESLRQNEDYRLNQLSVVIHQPAPCACPNTRDHPREPVKPIPYIRSSEIPSVLLGDFNTDKSRDEFSYLASHGYSMFSDLDTPTCPFDTQVDYIVTNPQKVKICQSFSLPYPFSDHLPVMCNLRLTASATQDRTKRKAYSNSSYPNSRNSRVPDDNDARRSSHRHHTDRYHDQTYLETGHFRQYSDRDRFSSNHHSESRASQPSSHTANTRSIRQHTSSNFNDRTSYNSQTSGSYNKSYNDKNTIYNDCSDGKYHRTHNDNNRSSTSYNRRSCDDSRSSRNRHALHDMSRAERSCVKDNGLRYVPPHLRKDRW